MNKLFINLLLILGINFSLFGSDGDTSERQLIYEEENSKAENANSLNNPVPFDRSSKRFEFDGSRENLDVCWIVNGQRVSQKDLENSSKVQRPGPTVCFVNVDFLRGGRKYLSPEPAGSQSDENRESIFFIVHTKYNLDPSSPEYEARCAEAEAYARSVEAYNLLSKEERLKQMQEHLKREHDRSKTSTYVDPNSSKQ